MWTKQTEVLLVGRVTQDGGSDGILTAASMWRTSQAVTAKGPGQCIFRLLIVCHNSWHLEVIHGISIVVSPQPHHMAPVCCWKG